MINGMILFIAFAMLVQNRCYMKIMDSHEPCQGTGKRT